MAIVPSFIPNADNINGAINSFFGNDSIDVIRSIDYDTKYLWAINVVGNGTPNAPFDKFFPAQDVTLPFAISETETIEFAQSSVQVPIKTTGKELSITFYDDENRTLLKWLSDWINIDIQNGGKFMSGIYDNHTIESIGSVVRSTKITGGERVIPVRTLSISLLSKNKKVDTTTSYSYDVFPVGELTWSGDHSSEAQTYTMRFAIVKKVGAPASKTDSFADISKDILSKFI